MLKHRVVSSVIKQPKPEKNHGDQQAKNDGGGNEIHLGEKCLKRAQGANRT